MLRLAVDQQLTLGDVQGGEQRLRVVPPVVVRHAFYIPQSHRKDRLRAFQRCHRLFSSTHSTIASSGGSRYNPTLSRTIDPAHCLRLLPEIRAVEEAYSLHFGRHDLLTVYYEDLVSHSADTQARIQRFLHVPARPRQSRLLRQETRPLRDAIENYDSPRAALAATPSEIFFDD